MEPTKAQRLERLKSRLLLHQESGCEQCEEGLCMVLDDILQQIEDLKNEGAVR